MTCITLPFLTRKPILTLEQFEDCYENTHLPYIKSVFGQLAALKHRRWYLARADSKDSGYPPLALAGKPEHFDYDCITEVSLRMRRHYTS
ncbi:hypothetical protein PMIN07_011803 [Paraphaeosphaeria minitans]